MNNKITLLLRITKERNKKKLWKKLSLYKMGMYLHVELLKNVLLVDILVVIPVLYVRVFVRRGMDGLGWC